MLREGPYRFFLHSGAACQPKHNPRFADRQTLIAGDPTAPGPRRPLPSVVR